MDSWAHGNQQGFLFGRDIIKRIWLTHELIPLLARLSPDSKRNKPDVKDTLKRVFLAPCIDNITYYAPGNIDTDDQSRTNFVMTELAANDANLELYDYTIISINQNFLMFIFIFNFGFTNDILFGGSSSRGGSIRNMRKNKIGHQYKNRNSTRKFAKKRSTKKRPSIKLACNMQKRNYK
jgi:hypothetical protein